MSDSFPVPDMNFRKLILCCERCLSVCALDVSLTLEVNSDCHANLCSFWGTGFMHSGSCNDLHTCASFHCVLHGEMVCPDIQAFLSCRLQRDVHPNCSHRASPCTNFCYLSLVSDVVSLSQRVETFDSDSTLSKHPTLFIELSP